MGFLAEFSVGSTSFLIWSRLGMFLGGAELVKPMSNQLFEVTRLYRSW